MDLRKLFVAAALCALALTVIKTENAQAQFFPTPTPAPTPSPIAIGNLTISGSYPYTFTVATPCPSPGANVTVTGSWPCTIAASTPAPLTFSSPLVNTAGTVACATCFLTTGAQTAAGNKVFTGATIIQGAGNTDLYVIAAAAAQAATFHVNAVTAGNALIVLNSGPTPGPSPAPGPYQLGSIRFTSNNYMGVIANLYGGVTDDGAGNHCGYLQMESTAVGVTPGLLEAVQAVCNGHVGMPQDIIGHSLTTPSTCAAFAVCSTVTVTFPFSFYSNAGAAIAPYCYAPSFQDITDSTIIWIGNIKTVSATAVVYNYTPTTATAVGHDLTLVSTCHSSNY